MPLLNPVDEKALGIKGWLRGPKKKEMQARKDTGRLVPGKERIAILPFANISPDPHDEYFADGMTEELISTLSKIETLKVISRTSVMRYKHSEKSLEEISRELNVGSILEGSVRKAANDLRITVKLIDVQKDEHLWSKDYERSLENVFAVQKEIAHKIVESLPVDILPRDKRSIEKRETSSVDAYELFLKGRYLWNKCSKESMTESIAYFRAANQKDPSYALPYVGLADAFSVLVVNKHIPPDEGYPKAKQALVRALEIDDNLGEARASLGLLKCDADWDWAGAEEEYKKAIKLKPNYATAHHWYSILLGATLGKMDEGLAEAKKALELDPLSPIINLNIAYAYMATGDLGLADQHAKKALDLEPDFLEAFEIHVWLDVEKGKFQEAISRLEKIESMFPERHKRIRLAIASVHASSGNIDRAKQIFKDAASKPGEDYVSWLNHAEYYATIGEKDKAFEALNNAFENHEQEMCSVKGFPEFRSLSSDPRFGELLAKMNLPTSRTRSLS